jgi:hypothetical protein
LKPWGIHGTLIDYPEADRGRRWKIFLKEVIEVFNRVIDVKE